MNAEEMFSAIVAMDDEEREKLAAMLCRRRLGSSIPYLTEMSFTAFWPVTTEEYGEITKIYGDQARELARIREARQKPAKSTIATNQVIHSARKKNGTVDWNKAAELLGIECCSDSVKRSYWRFKAKYPGLLGG